MRILALTNLYPTPFHPTRAPFNRHPMRILGEKYPTQVIVPISWTDERNARKKSGNLMPTSRTASIDGLTVYYPKYRFTPRILRNWYGNFYYHSVKSLFRRIAQEFKPDLVFASWAYPDGWAGIKLARENKLPVVLKVHGSDIKLLDQYPKRKKKTCEALRNADAVIAVSEDLRDQVIKLGVNKEKAFLVYNGVDTGIFSPGSKSIAREKVNLTVYSKEILFIGNLVPVKGIENLITAFKVLSDREVNANLNVVGQGPLLSKLNSLASNLGLAGRVHFLGALPQADLANWYRAADVFVLPSLSEGVPNVLLEASASGCPWVASNVGGIPEIAKFGKSLLVPPENPNELALAIEKQLNLPTDNSEINVGRTHHDCVREMEDIFKSVVESD